MAEIHIVAVPTGESHFRVTVTDEASSSTHDVTVPADTISRLGWAGTPEDLLRHSFQFLLARESKESILPAFTIDVIGRYFSDWEATARAGF